tara:strand:+ start:777 stop:1970 length:1194 start_codon:yes stop_codon:yes gene_type:complete
MIKNIMSYKEKRNKSRKNAKGSIARRLENFNKKGRLINVDGFIGKVETNINIPMNEDLCIEASTQNLPIYVISAHGENVGNLHFNRHSLEKGYPIVDEKRGGQMFEKCEDRQWVVYSAPIRTLICPSSHDVSFMEYLATDPQNVKSILFSNNPNKLFDNITQKKTKFCTPSFSLPGMPFSKKRYWFYDSPGENSSFDWFMGVYPILKGHSSISPLYDETFDYRNETLGDMEDRIFNDDVIKKFSWRGQSKMLKKYKILTKLIKESLPTYNKKNNRWTGGTSVTQKQIMDIMGQGIYISLTCSPFVNLNPSSTHIDTDVLYVVGESVIEDVSKSNLKKWKKQYDGQTASASLRNRRCKFKQEILDDTEAPGFGKQDTGISVSTRGRIMYKDKKYINIV